MASCRHPTDQELNDLTEHFYTKEGKLFVKKLYGAPGCEKPVGHEIKGGKRRLKIQFRGRYYLGYRVIYFLHCGVWPDDVIDHINGDINDNRPENLRVLTNQQNNRSYARSRDGVSSRYRGVCWIVARKRWQSSVKHMGKRCGGRYFTSEEEAALHYNYTAQLLGFNKEAFNIVF